MIDSGSKWRRSVIRRIVDEVGSGSDCRVINRSIRLAFPLANGRRFDATTVRLLTRKVNAAAIAATLATGYQSGPFHFADWAVLRRTTGETIMELLFRPSVVVPANQKKAARMYIKRSLARGESPEDVLNTARLRYHLPDEWVQGVINEQ